MPSSTDVGVDAFRPPTSKPAASSFSVASSWLQPGGRRHLAAARPDADRQRHLRLRAEEGEEGAVELGLVGRAARPAGPARARCSPALRARRRPAGRPRSRCCSSSGSRRCSCSPVTSGTSVVVSRVSARPIRSPIRTAAIAAAIQRRRRLRASSSGSTSSSASTGTATTGGSAAKAAVPPPAPGSFSAASRAAMKASALWKRCAGVLLQRPHHHRVERRGDPRVDRARPLRRLRDLFHRHRDGGVGLEGDAAGQRLVEDHPDRVEVGDGGDVEALGLLGREVVRGPHHRAGLGDLRDAGAGDAEVGDDRLALAVDDHVLRLQVAVDDRRGGGRSGPPPAPGGSARPPARG